MNKILHLFSEEYVKNLFEENLLSLYPKYTGIKKIKIKPFKKMIWTSTYHVVVGYDVHFLTANQESEKIMVVCSAHSNEERENVFNAMTFLYENKFNTGIIDIPRPLFYSEYFHGTFYEGIEGENLLHYIKNKDHEEIESLVTLSAQLFSKLHQLPVTESANFNPLNAHIKTVLPGSERVINEMAHRFEGKFGESYAKIYKHLIEREESYFHSKDAKFCLIHGDAHTENIIHTGKGRVGLIDFTDFCLGDFARDIGTFMQQLEYRIAAKTSDAEYGKKMSDLFLKSYLTFSGIELTADLKDRIRLYYDWTTIRTSVFLFLKHDSNPASAEVLLEKVKKDLEVV